MTRHTLRLAVRFANHPDGPFPVIDFFAHRVTPKQDYTLEEAATAVAMLGLRHTCAKPLQSDQVPHLDPHDINQMCVKAVAAPFADFAPGSMVSAVETTLDADIILDVDMDGTCRIGSAYLSNTLFLKHVVYDSYNETQYRTRSKYLQDELAQGVSTMRLKLGLISAALPMPIDDLASVDTCAAIYARMARVLDLGYGSGAQAAESAEKDISSLMSRIKEAWILEPDHITKGDKFVAGAQFRSLVRDIPESFLEFTQTCWDAVGTSPGMLRKASLAKKGQRVGKSNHEELQLHSAINDIDALIEAQAPLSLLKPAAQKRQAKLRGTAAA